MHTIHSEQHQLHATAGLRPEAHPSLTAEVPERVEVIPEALGAAGVGRLMAPSDHGLDPILAALDEAVAAVWDFAPRYLVVSAGFDIAAGDPVAIGGFSITIAGVGEIGRRIAALGRPTVVVQEVGYRLDRLGGDVAAFLRPFA